MHTYTHTYTRSKTTAGGLALSIPPLFFLATPPDLPIGEAPGHLQHVPSEARGLLPEGDLVLSGTQDSRLEDPDLLVASEQRQTALDVDDCANVDLGWDRRLWWRGRRRSSSGGGVRRARCPLPAVRVGRDGQGCGEAGVGAGDVDKTLNADAAAIIEGVNAAARVLVHGDDDARDAHPLDGVVQVEEDVLA